MCGIAGILAQVNVQQDLFDALTVLQHRGQDAAGIITSDGKHFFLRKANGLVRDVFHQRHMQRLQGHLGIAHVRYPTAGSSSESEAQPFYVNAPYGIALAHNGNLTNASDLRELLTQAYRRHINTQSDSELLLNILAHELEVLPELDVPAVCKAVTALMAQVQGGYAAVAMIMNFGLMGFRDPHGIRPLVFGKRDTDQGPEYMFASESVALDTLGFTLVDDVQPGEVVIVDMNHQLHRHVCQPGSLRPCAFEFVYLARQDSVMDGISVYQARLNMGERLAQQILNTWPDHDIDVVIPIPDTARSAAMSLAVTLGVPFREGFVKNRYIGRTFIMPGQQERKKSVRKKLNPITSELQGKNVLLIDDSIVRGTTCKQIIQMARHAGAKRVYFASAAPPVHFPNVYGIDMPVRKELIAFDHSIEEVCQKIGADKLIYQELDDLIGALRDANPAVAGFETSVFDGHYIAGNIDAAYLKQLEDDRNDSAKLKRAGGSSVIDLSNAVI
jgi:amidophosphoribosyltransferase